MDCTGKENLASDEGRRRGKKKGGGGGGGILMGDTVGGINYEKKTKVIKPELGDNIS